jgi:glycosyltransferase involved in cell wall biosynthesis
MHTLWRLDREACRRRTCLRCVARGRRPPQLWRRTGAIERGVRHLDAFIAPSEFSRRTHQDNGLAGRIVVLPNFAPAAEPATDDGDGGAAAVGTAVDGDGGRRPFFLCVGRLERLKGVQDAIEAFRGFDRADLLIAGDGAMAEELRRRAHGLEHVRFLGWLTQAALAPLYREAAAVLVPSLCYEAAFPLVGIEAFAAATPVIARRIGALEQLEDLGGGWLFSDAGGLTAALGAALDDAVARRERGRRARQAYEERFTEQVHVESYLALVGEHQRRRAGEAPA